MTTRTVTLSLCVDHASQAEQKLTRFTKNRQILATFPEIDDKEIKINSKHIK